jgi:hypothetical protein
MTSNTHRNQQPKPYEKKILELTYQPTSRPHERLNPALAYRSLFTCLLRSSNQLNLMTHSIKVALILLDDPEGRARFSTIFFSFLLSQT